MEVRKYFSFKSRKNNLINIYSVLLLSLFILMLVISAIVETVSGRGSNFFKNLFTFNEHEIYLSLIILLILGISFIAIMSTDRSKIIKNEKRSVTSLIKAIILLVESKDDYTSEHHRKVANLATKIAEKMRLSEERIKLIYKTSLIHDIGKINISQDVLNKKTKLDDSELSQIHAHPLVGYEIIKDVHNFENMAKIILQHHERLDGSGYPYGLVSDEIMIEAKIIAVADVFEAMTSKRPYGGAFEIPKVLDTLRSGSGKFYDDAAVAACLDLFEKENLRLN